MEPTNGHKGRTHNWGWWIFKKGSKRCASSCGETTSLLLIIFEDWRIRWWKSKKKFLFLDRTSLDKKVENKKAKKNLKIIGGLQKLLKGTCQLTDNTQKKPELKIIILLLNSLWKCN